MQLSIEDLIKALLSSLPFLLMNENFSAEKTFYGFVLIPLIIVFLINTVVPKIMDKLTKKASVIVNGDASKSVVKFLIKECKNIDIVTNTFCDTLSPNGKMYYVSHNDKKFSIVCSVGKDGPYKDECVFTIYGESFATVNSFIEFCKANTQIYNGSNKRVQIDDGWTFEKLTVPAQIYLDDDVMKIIDSLDEKCSTKSKIRRVMKQAVLLYGPPGTGKTSISAYLSKKYQRTILEMTLQQMKFGVFKRIVGDIGSKSILVFNDIDRSDIFTPREKSEKTEITVNTGNAGKASDRDLTLQDIMNFLDNPPENVIVIFTVNDLSKIPEVMFRPGRIDVKLKIDYPTYKIVNRIFKDAYGEHFDSDSDTRIHISTAEIIVIVETAQTAAEAKTLIQAAMSH